LIGLGPSGLLWLAPFPQGMQLPDPLPSKLVGIVVAAPQGILPFDAVAHPVVYVSRHHFPRRPRNPGQPVLGIVGIAIPCPVVGGRVVLLRQDMLDPVSCPIPDKPLCPPIGVMDGQKLMVPVVAVVGSFPFYR